MTNNPDGLSDARASLEQQAHEWRKREVQAIGAAISTRSWHAVEQAYNNLRDKMDSAGCWWPPKPTPPASTSTAIAAGADTLAKHVAEVMAEDGGCWTPCSGCQESDEGYVSEKLYPYSSIFKCQPGGGCSECGGIGVVWNDGAYLASWGDDLAAAPKAVSEDGATGLREAVKLTIADAAYHLRKYRPHCLEALEAALAASPTDATGAEKCDLCCGSGVNGNSQLWPDYPPLCRACNGSGNLSVAGETL